ncbi:MAG TPA: triple tyrosine motif-containing protein, partial [Flavisolibacter sp.]|nr:triple tyrosine motif-containing protein [Flavisolibacter sp.]
LPASATGRYVFTHYNIHQGAIATVSCIKRDHQNNLWFATTNAGVVQYNGKTFTRYTTAQGLSNNNVNSIVEDREGNLWFLTYNGLCKMAAGQRQKQAGKNPERAPGSFFTNYLYADGFLGVGGEFNSLTLGRDGTIWAGTTNRITGYHSERDIPDTSPPQIRLSGISLFGETINWLAVERKKDSSFLLRNGVEMHDVRFKDLSKWYNVAQGLDLAYDNNYLTFQFVGITINKPRHIRYQYRLVGLDENWSLVTENSFAAYNNLPPGHYAFLVKAVNSEGYWSPTLNYPFTIRPPWWKTSWFSALAILLLVAVFYGTLRWRLQQKFRLQLERSRKEKQLAELQQRATELEMQALRAQMNPHFIFNSLNSINRFILQNN